MNRIHNKIASDTYVVDFKGIPVNVSRRNIKNINMYIRAPYGEVLVTVPKRASDVYLFTFLLRKHNWIVKHRQLIQNKYDIQCTSAGDEMGSKRYTEEQQVYLREAIERYAEKWEKIMGVHCHRWTIRDMRTRWGSCSVNKQTIRINLRLADKSEECIELIVVHELTHLLEASHNKVFKGYMSKFLPDWRDREKILKESYLRR